MAEDASDPEVPTAERLLLLVRVGRIIASGRELGEVLQRTADAIHELLGYANVDLPLLDPRDPLTLRIEARGGAYKERITHVDRMPIDRGVMGAAVRERRTQRVDDVARDPRYVQPPSGFPVRAELAVPILHAGQVLGVVNVEGGEPFGELDVQILEMVADHLGVAVTNARLDEQGRDLAVLEERQRLARELHDSITQMIFSVTLLADGALSTLERDAQESKRRLERLRELARQALSEMRALLRELAPRRDSGSFSSREFPPPAVALLYREGLAAVLSREVRALDKQGIAARLSADAYERQSREREEVLLRIAQEALANVARHSRAGNVEVVIACREGEVLLRIEDDGQGFDAQEALERARSRSADGSGLGLASMRDRIRALHGTFRVVSAPGAGTTVEAALPR
ncbi:MAG: GAF domain-containing sensor histidine kinase [Thermoanaerobaculia bacterium]